MNRVFLTAGIIIVIGFAIMATGTGLYMANSDEYWAKVPGSPFNPEWINVAKKQDMYSTVSNIGLMIMGLGLAILAFGFARDKPTVQFREVPSHIPMQQYPQPPQPPQTP